MLKKFILFSLFATACFADFVWSPPLDLPQSGTNAFGKVAVNDNMAIAVWASDDGSQHTVAATISNDGGTTWSGPITLSETTPGVNSSSPEVDINVNNEIVVCWKKDDGAGNIITQVIGSNNGGSSWAGPFDLNPTPPPAPNAQLARIAINDNGVAFCVWYNDNHLGLWNIEATYTNNIMAPWPPGALSVISDGVNNCNNPEITISSNANYMTACSWTNNGLGQVETRVFDSSLGIWVPPAPVAQGASSYASTIAINNSNNMIVTWMEPSGGFNVIRASTSTDGVVWVPSPSNPLSDPTEHSFYPSVALNSSGNAIVTWNRGPVPTSSIYGATSSDNGNNWTPWFPVSNIGSLCIYPHVKLNDAGEAVCIYQSGFSSVVHASTSLDSGATWTPQIDLSVPGGNTSVVDLAPNGNTVGIWHNGGLIQIAYSPFSPFSLSYTKATTKLLLQRDNTVELIWSPVSEAVLYRIYEDYPFQNYIYSGKNNYFVVHGLEKGETKKYYFSWIKSDGTESAAEEVVITY